MIKYSKLTVEENYLIALTMTTPPYRVSRACEGIQETTWKLNGHEVVRKDISRHCHVETNWFINHKPVIL